MQTRKARGSLFIDPLDWPQSVDATTYANQRIHQVAIYFWKWGLFFGVACALPLGMMIGLMIGHWIWR